MTHDQLDEGINPMFIDQWIGWFEFFDHPLSNSPVSRCVHIPMNGYTVEECRGGSREVRYRRCKAEPAHRGD